MTLGMHAGAVCTLDMYTLNLGRKGKKFNGS